VKTIMMTTIGSRLKFVVLGLALTLMVILLCGVMLTGADASTVRIGIASDVKDFNPSWVDSAHWAILRTLYDTLLEFNAEGELIPYLATNWEVSGYNITIQLREGVMFHGGKELTAEIVAANIEFYQDEAVGGHTYGTVKHISKISIDSKYKLTITIEGMTPEMFLRELPIHLQIADPEFFPLEREGAGTGPFKLEEWIPGERIVMVKNNNYWQEGLPKSDKIEWVVFDSPRTMVDALVNGLVDWVLPVSFEFVEELQGNADIVLGEGKQPFQNILLLGAGKTDSPFSNKMVRQAMQYALDREAFVALAFYGIGDVKTTIYWDKDPYYAGDLEPYAYYDLTRTRKLLQQAGYDEENPLEFALSFSSAFPTFRPIAELIKEDLASIGVHMDIVIQEPTTWIDSLYKGNYEATLSFMAPNNLFSQSHLRADAQNAPWRGLPPQDYLEAVEIALTSTDEAAVRSAHVRIQMILADESWEIVLTTRPQLFAWRSSIRGVDRQINNVPILQYVESAD